jgi:hypothetical protein
VFEDQLDGKRVKPQQSGNQSRRMILFLLCRPAWPGALARLAPESRITGRHQAESAYPTTPNSAATYGHCALNNIGTVSIQNPGLTKKSAIFSDKREAGDSNARCGGELAPPDSTD